VIVLSARVGSPDGAKRNPGSPSRASQPHPDFAALHPGYARYYEQHATAMAAIQREKNIKHWSRKWKIDLIRSLNPNWRDLWEDITR